jgi:hypothetical protein
MGAIIFQRVHERAVAKCGRRGRHRGGQTKRRRIAAGSQRGCERRQRAIAGERRGEEAHAELIEKVDLGKR